MVDDVILNKSAVIERCVARAREEYAKDPAGFASDLTRQDAAVLNLQRACQAALDLGHHLCRLLRLGPPQSARDVFIALRGAGEIDPALSRSLQGMVGYRNIAVHDYQALALPVTIAIIEHHLDDLLQFARQALAREAP